MNGHVSSADTKRSHPNYSSPGGMEHHHLTPLATSTMRALGTLTDQQSLMVNCTTITMEGRGGGSAEHQRAPLDPRTLANHQPPVTTTNQHLLSNHNHDMQQRQQQQLTGAHQLSLHPDIVLLGSLSSSDESVDERPHICDVCSASYKTRTHLRRHMFIHLKARPYPCSECGKGFNRKEHLNKHIEAVHSLTKYRCGYCSKEISRKDHLNRHIKNMHTFSTLLQQTIAADGCGEQLETKGRRSNTPGNTQLNLNNTHNNNTHQQQHYNTSNDQTTTPAELPLPPPPLFSSPFSSSYNNNGRSNSTGGALIPKSKSSLLDLFTCSHCHSAFTSDKDLALHSKTHKPQPYKCAECSRAYTRREKLTEHVRCFHQGQKFTCDYCGKDLSRKDHVLRHIRSVHPEVLASRFVEIAESSGLDPNELMIRSSCTNNNNGPSTLQGTNPTTNSSNIPSMGEMGQLLRSVCHICLKVFGTSYHLARHIQSCHNNNLRPFSCASCSKQFKRKDHLTNHMKSHCPSLRTHLEEHEPPAVDTSELGAGLCSSGDVDEGGGEHDDGEGMVTDSLQIEMMIGSSSLSEDQRFSIKPKSLEPSKDRGTNIKRVELGLAGGSGGKRKGNNSRAQQQDVVGPGGGMRSVPPLKPIIITNNHNLNQCWIPSSSSS